MTVVAVSNNNTRREDMNGAYTGVNIGVGGAGGIEVDFFYEDVQSWSRQVTNTAARGFSVGITAIDMTAAANLVLLGKYNLTNFPALNSAAYNIFIGDGAAGTDARRYVIADDATLVTIVGGSVASRVYPVRGGWQLIPIDVNELAWVDEVVGTAPTLTAIDEIGTSAGVASSAKGENIQMDAIDFSEGLWIVSGTSTDPDGTWDDFKAHDEDEGGAASLGDRIGHVSTLEGIFYVFGQFTIGETDAGTNTDTEFTDALKTIVFPGGRVAAGWNSVELELAQAATAILHTNMTFVGQGRNNLKHFFDSSADQVDDVNEEFDIVDHGFLNGDFVIYADEGGTQIVGLTDGTGYYVRAINLDSFSLHTGGRLDAHNDTNQVAVTAAGTGEAHSFQLGPDTRPNFNHRGTSGSADWIACSFVGCGDFICTSAVTWVGCLFVGCNFIDLVGALLTDCAIADFTLAEGIPAVETNDLADISGCDFTRTAGVGQLGHAIEITVAGTYAFNNNTLTGYGPDKASFETITGIDDATEIITTDAAHGFVDGDAVYYGDEGGTDAVGLTDGNRYYVNQISTTTLSLHVTRADAVADANRVNLTDGSTGETHYLYSAHAAILNSSGGLVTINVAGGTLPSIRNTPGSTTVAQITVTHTVDNLRTNDRVVWIRVSDEAELENKLAAAGVATYQYNYVADVDIWVQVLSGDNTKKNSLTEITLGDTDATFSAVQANDPVYNNP